LGVLAIDLAVAYVVEAVRTSLYRPVGTG